MLESLLNEINGRVLTLSFSNGSVSNIYNGSLNSKKDVSSFILSPRIMLTCYFFLFCLISSLIPVTKSTVTNGYSFVNLANILGKYLLLIIEEHAIDKVPLTSTLEADKRFLTLCSSSTTSLACFNIISPLGVTFKRLEVLIKIVSPKYSSINFKRCETAG